jgi:hypothetical protein
MISMDIIHAQMTKVGGGLNNVEDIVTLIIIDCL